MDIETNITLKHIGSSYLYNMLQDFRHLLIFDLRPNFATCQIRDSFPVSDETTNELILEVIDLSQKKSSQKQEKYPKIKKIRRYFFVSDQKVQESNKNVQKILKCLEKRKGPEDKYYGLNEAFRKFAQTYPFMCLSLQKIQELRNQNQQIRDKYLLYPYSKFPSEIIPNRLYLSSVYSSNSKQQLKDLKIKVLVDFIHYPENQSPPTFKEEGYTYLRFPIDPQVPAIYDFDTICSQIGKKNDDRILMYCKDGETISAAFAVAFLMWSTKGKLNAQMATLKVCQAISRVQVDKNIFTQLLVYKPQIKQ